MGDLVLATLALVAVGFAMGTVLSRVVGVPWVRAAANGSACAAGLVVGFVVVPTVFVRVGFGAAALLIAGFAAVGLVIVWRAMRARRP